MMKLHSIYFLLAFGFLTACNSAEEESTSSNGNRAINNPATSTESAPTNSVTNLEPSEILTDSLRIGKSTSRVLSFPGNYDCVDGKIKWIVRSALNRASLDKDDICEPTLTTTTDFTGDGDVSLEANLVIVQSNQERLIRWTVTRLEFKSAPIIAPITLTRNRADWLSHATNLSGMGGTMALREVSYFGSPATAQMVIGIDGHAVTLDGAAFFWEPVNRRNVNREFLFNLNISDVDNDEENLQITAGCSAENPSIPLYTECPFEFDPVNSNQMQLLMRMKLDPNRGLDSAIGVGLSLKKVFLAGMSQHRVTDVWIEARHPETSEVSRATIAKIILFAFNWI